MELNVPPSPSAVRGATRRRLAHGKEHGFTLVEVLISISLLTLVAASLAGAFGIGIRVLGPTGAQASLRGNNDLMAFEQQIGADVARASCLAAGATLIPSGGCTTFNAALGGTPAARCPTQYLLCVGWYAPGSGSPCHELVFSSKTSGADMWVERRDLSTGIATRISTGGLGVSGVNLHPTPTSTNAYSWTQQVDITVTQQVPAQSPPLRSPSKAMFHVVPLATDPLSAVPQGTPSC